MIRIWLRGLLTRRSGRLLGVATGTALTVALLATLGGFIANSAATMTKRTIAAVPVDWQVLLAPGADAAAVASAISAATPATAVQTVGYAAVPGLSATTGGTVQTTGAATVLGIDPAYRQAFPSELRPLIGSLDGVLLAQQTAANLHVTVGDTVTIQRSGLPPIDVVVAGVVDLPQADSLFQAVGVAAGIAPQAPPDNVLLLPTSQWHALFDPQAALRPDSLRTQLHVRIGHDLPSDPAAAASLVQQQAHHVEAQVAGNVAIGNNISARLAGARADASYAEVLFLFLGLPGALLAIALTLAVAGAGAARRRQEQALLKVRGATSRQIIGLASIEGLIAGVCGLILGLLAAALATQLIAPDGSPFAPTGWQWSAIASLLGLLFAWAAIVLPVWRETRSTTVTAARAAVGRNATPLWQRLYLDVLILAVAAIMFWRTASTGYQIVLAPEGVPQTAVAYEAFLAPLGFWLGTVLLAARLWRTGLTRGQRALAWLLQPVAHELAGLVARSLGRQHALQTRGVILVALALAFATSTAIFNTTYNAQARVDAELTNGADVQVRGTTAAPPANQLVQLAGLPQVTAAVPMQHRFAYVGSDLQDLFGIDPKTIGQATHLANAFFANGDAQATLALLAAQPNGLLVSEETMKDFQLHPSDTVNLRLQGADKQYHIVAFRFIGVVREFPTAPKDSFLVANASYIAQQTGIAAAEVVLLRANGDSATLAAQVQQVVGGLPGVIVTDIGTTQRAISSSLTAVDLRSLTALELAFAVLLIAGAAGLVLALSLVERQRSFAILAALGAKRAQLASFIWSEGLLLLGGGLLFGSVVGVIVAQMLVALLTHVFDPPPESLALPWGYLALACGAVIGSIVLAVLATIQAAQRGVIEQVRGL